MYNKGIFPSIFVCVLWIILAAYLNSRYGGSPTDEHWHKRWWNTEASAHFLNTLGRYHQRPLSEHWFAIGAPCVEPPDQPCVKYGSANKPGSAVVSSERLAGEDVYISFPPGSMAIASLFVLPLHKVLGIDAMTVMRGFNWFLCLIAALIFVVILSRLSYIPQVAGYLLIGMAALPLIISVEAMHSHHLSLWAHQVFQPFLAFTFLISVGPMTRKRSFILGVLCAVACWIEWTAYLLIMAIGVLVLVRSSKDKRILNFLLFCFLSTLGGISLLLYYDQLIGLKSYFDALAVRFSARSTVEYYSWKDWFISIMQSYGPWILCLLPIIILGMIAKIKSVKKSAELIQEQLMLALLGVCAFIFLENIIMFEHSIVYTFDRLKFGFIIGLVIMIFGSQIIKQYSMRGLLFTMFFVFAGALASFWQFVEIYTPYWK